ncbi:MAG: sigma 54-interacting transcriptional regulator [Bilophila wadsworthia]
MARQIHLFSQRKGPFVAVHPASTPEQLFESEFFGHEKGSFTGATSQKIGYFEMANGGTLFIDEVGEMPLSMQVKLLRVLQNQRFMRVGGTAEIISRFRLVAATNRDLRDEVAKGRFREDLFYRLSVVPLRVPPLRERREDIIGLAEAFAESYCQRYGRPSLRLTDAERACL